MLLEILELSLALSIGLAAGALAYYFLRMAFAGK